MKPCISQATTLSTPFEADLDGLRAERLDGGRALADEAGDVPGVALGRPRPGRCSRSTGSWRRPRRRQGGLLLSRGAEREAHWDHFRRRLDLLRELEVPVLVVAADFVRDARPRRLRPGRRRRSREAAELARPCGRPAGAGVPEGGQVLRQPRHHAGPDRAARRRGAGRLPRPVPLLHRAEQVRGPGLPDSPSNLAWVQVCDLSGTPRELAGDGDRILPGEGDFQIGPILDHLGRIGYDGYVSLEVLNPQLWQIPADRVADLGYQALCRVLGHWNQAGSWGGS